MGWVNFTQPVDMGKYMQIENFKDDTRYSEEELNELNSEINRIASNLLTVLEIEDIVFLRNVHRAKMVSYHHTLGQYIRNSYNLWERNWTPIIKQGIDVSIFHPDAISLSVLEALHDKITSNPQSFAVNQ